MCDDVDACDYVDGGCQVNGDGGGCCDGYDTGDDDGTCYGDVFGDVDDVIMTVWMVIVMAMVEIMVTLVVRVWGYCYRDGYGVVGGWDCDDCDCDVGGYYDDDVDDDDVDDADGNGVY